MRKSMNEPKAKVSPSYRLSNPNSSRGTTSRSMDERRGGPSGATEAHETRISGSRFNSWQDRPNNSLELRRNDEGG